MVTSISEQLKKLNPDDVACVKSNFDEEALNFKFSGSDFFDWVKNENDGKLELLYKNQVAAKSYKEICDILPELKDSIFLKNNKRPYFISNLENIRRAIDEKEGIAVEGGPCLFGNDEVLVSVKLLDGVSHTFDYSTGRKSDSDIKGDILSSELEFHNFVLDNAKNISSITFVDNKKAVTVDEYASIYILFDIANCLGCPFVLPIVDMSYQKYLEFVTREVDTNIREKAIDEFKNIVHGIADKYIAVADKISKDFKDVRYIILHDRDKELLSKYYEKRTPYIERKKVIHSLTDVPVRLEPIKDYCTMPALPLYFYDIKNILQIDCLDETDSHRKCKRAHRNVTTISALLYPEIIYENDMTMFNAPLSHKKYIDE